MRKLNWLTLGLILCVVVCLTACDGRKTQNVRPEPQPVTKPAQMEAEVPANPEPPNAEGSSEITPSTQPEATESSAPHQAPVIIRPLAQTDAESTPFGYDLEFYFCSPGTGNYEFWIAPESSEEWVRFESEGVTAGACTYALEHDIALNLVKYQMDFQSETNGLWKMRTTRRFPEADKSECTVLTQWHNIPILGNQTLLYAMGVTLWHYPGDDGEQLEQVIVVDRMEFCDSCPSEWTNGT